MPDGARRARFPHEVAGRVNFAAIEQEVARIAERLRARNVRAYVAAVEALTAHLEGLRDVRAAPEWQTRTLANWLGELRDPMRPATWAGLDEALGDAGEIGDELRRAVEDGAAGVWAEAREQGAPVDPTLPELDEPERNTLDAGARRLHKAPALRITELAGRYVYDNPVFTMTPDQLIGNVRAHLLDSGLGDFHGVTAARAEAQKAHGMGRTAGAARVAKPARIYASELLDRNTCGPCSLVDGREYASEAAARLDYPTGIYRACDGGDRCRGTLVYVWSTEAPPTDPGLPPPPIGRGGRPGDPVVDMGSDPTAPRYALSRSTLRDVHGIELTEGQRVRILGGTLHRTDLGAGVLEMRRGRLLYVGDGYPDTEAVLRTLDELTDRIPEGMGEALDLLAAHPGRKRSLTGSGEAMASSNGTEVVFWQRYVLDDAETVGAIFDHEFGHSIIKHWNAGGAGRLRTLDNTPNPNDPAWQLGGPQLEPGAGWVRAAELDAERARQANERFDRLRSKVVAEVRAEGVEPVDLIDEVRRRVDAAVARMRPANRDAARTVRTRFSEPDRPPGEHRITPDSRGSWDGKAGNGVSDYGASEPAEDWAEAFARYLRDQRTGRLGVAPDGSPTTFRHLFPNRAELLDALFAAYRRGAGA